MKVSVITPFTKSHERFLIETYESLREQSFEDWEWVLLPNLGGKCPECVEQDRRIRIVETEDESGGRNSIGRLKYEACSHAGGEIIVELDADDLLRQDALERVMGAFEDKQIVFAYSNNAMFKDGSWEPSSFSEGFGWRSRPVVYKGHELIETIAWPPSAQMMRYIWWAPDHVRAWRASAYWQLGGHDKQLANGDDHDLCCRFYNQFGADGFRHIDECIYFYRLWDNQAFRVFNQEIQQQTDKNYCKYSRALATRWAKDNDLLLLDLGGRFNRWEGYKTADLLDADYNCDLNERWPFMDDSVGVIKAYHIFEHLRDPVHSMNEAYRVLAPGGWLFIEVPSTDGRGAWQDPTHCSFWNQNSIAYYTDRDYARFVQPKYCGRFQKSRCVTYFPTEDWRQRNISVVQADLIALKEPYSERPAGEVKI
jgi:SAM-dependent methyltransferase